MFAEFVPSLVALGIMIVVTLGLIKLLLWLMDLSYILGDWIFNSDSNLLLRLLAVIPWALLLVYRVFWLVAGALAFWSLLNEAKDWLKK